jgi:hypothetical protein
MYMLNDKKPKKEKELAQLEKAFGLLGIGNYEIIDKDNESPDFIVNIGGKYIGIEVTEIHRKLGAGNSAKAEADLPIIIEESIRIYNQKGGVPFAFGIIVNGTIAVEKRKSVCHALGEFLFDYSSNFLQSQSPDIHKIIIDIDKYPLLVSINEIFAQSINSADAVGFAVTSFDSIPVDNNALESAICKKLALLPTYRQRCKIIWLLIALPAIKLSGDLRLPDTELTSQDNEFDAIYVLDEYRSQVQRINKGRRAQ